MKLDCFTVRQILQHRTLFEWLAARCPGIPLTNLSFSSLDLFRLVSNIEEEEEAEEDGVDKEAKEEEEEEEEVEVELDDDEEEGQRRSHCRGSTLLALRNSSASWMDLNFRYCQREM